MEARRIEGIKALKRTGKAFDAEDLAGIFFEVTRGMKWPRIEGKIPGKVKYGDTVTIRPTQLPMPLVDLHAGKLTKSKKSDPVEPFLVSFTGHNGPAIARTTPKPGTRSHRLTVPAGAASGPVVAFFPFRIGYGIDIHEEFRKKQKMRKLPCPPGFRPDHGTYLTRYFPVLLGYWLVSCQQCADPAQSICPHGAIQFDAEGDCYVDQAVCRGQYCELGPPSGWDLRERVAEHPCWDCFNGSEMYSTKCQRNLISRVAHVDGCCGACGSFATVIPGYCFRELCSFGAVTGGNAMEGNRCGQVDTGDGSWGSGYEVDKSKFTGCMMCYMNINCISPKMKAHIQPRYTGTVYLESISFTPLHGGPTVKPPGGMNVYLGVYGQNQQGIFSDAIPLEQSIIHTPQGLDKRYKCIEHLHLAIYTRFQHRLIPMLYPQDLYDFVSDLRPLIGIIECHSSNRLIGRELRIPARRYGVFEITYSYLPRLTKLSI